jgi:hypothetical protein
MSLRKTFDRGLGFLVIGLALQAHAYAGSESVAVQGELAPSGTRLLLSAIPSPYKNLHIVFALGRAKTDQLREYSQAVMNPASPYYRKFLLPKQVGEMFGAPKSDVDEVVQFARSQGMKVTNVWENRMFVSVDSSVANAERVFGVRLLGYERPKSLETPGSPSTMSFRTAIPLFLLRFRTRSQLSSV